MSKRTCKWPECESEKIRARSLCGKHYVRASTVGTFEKPWEAWESRQQEKRKPRVCSVPDCGEKHSARGFCGKHYRRATRGQLSEHVDTQWDDFMSDCVWPGCDRKGMAHKMCFTHYARARKVNNFSSPWCLWDVREEQRTSIPLCEWPECARDAIAHKLCTMHYQRAKAMGTFTSPWEVWYAPKRCPECLDDFVIGDFQKEFCSRKCYDANYVKNNPDRMWLYGARRRKHQQLTSDGSVKYRDVVDQSEGICYLCQGELDYSLSYPDPHSPSLDHVVPLSRGGRHVLDNCAITHLHCNLRKGTKLVEELMLLR